MEHAHYSLRAEGASLEGTYYEEVEQGRANEMVVRVLFDDATSGQFQLAKLKQPDPQADADEPPIPQPQPEPKTAFEFDFRSQSELFHLSASQWLGKAGGTVQFLAMEDSFVFSKVRSSDAMPHRTAAPLCTPGCIHASVAPARHRRHN